MSKTPPKKSKAKPKNDKLKGEVWPGMSEELFAEVKVVVGKLQTTMNLRHWDILIFRSPAECDQTGAQITPVEGQWIANMHLGKDWATFATKFKRQSLVHELIHVHMQPMNDIMRLGLPRLLSDSAYEAIWESFRQQNEYTVDAMATAFNSLVDWQGAFD